ncbi:GNAT family N-acetyltransferase [Saccharothrix xinjiangensis]|uniref:GNAT family N-acetyltransferase n=1 Tax=Saccharothrix xinjiangensis TaxID=204798 RepID=A0ABV9YFI6_9PSEU
MDRAIADDPTDDLVGCYVGRCGGRPAGCAGFRLVDPATAELKRLHVAAGARGTGGGAALLSEVERGAAAPGARSVRLDTRADLVEARAPYARHGYGQVTPFNADPYAEYRFEKRL